MKRNAAATKARPSDSSQPSLSDISSRGWSLDLSFRGDAYTESFKKEFLSSLRSITFERTPRFGFISNPKKKRDRRREEKLYSKGVWGGSLKMADGDDNKCKRKKGWIVQVRDDLQGEYRVVYAPIRVRAVTDNPERGWVAACVRGGLITEDRRWDLSVGTQRLKADPTR